MFKCLSPEPLGISAPVNDLIEPALSYGFKGLELDVGAFSDLATRVGLPAARRLIDSAKLKLGYFRLPFEIACDDEAYQAGLQSLRKQAGLAAELGCLRSTATIAPGDDERPMHQNFAFHQRRLTEIAAVLAEHGIEFGVGFCATPEPRAGRAFEFIRTFDALKLMLGMAAAKNIGLAVDLFELWACGASFDDVRSSGLRVVAVILSDAAVEANAGDAVQTARLLPGEGGAIDSSAVLASLAESGYDGPVVPMPHPMRFKQMARNAVCKLAGEKLDHVWKTAGLSPAGKLTAVKR